MSFYLNHLPVSHVFIRNRTHINSQSLLLCYKVVLDINITLCYKGNIKGLYFNMYSTNLDFPVWKSKVYKHKLHFFI